MFTYIFFRIASVVVPFVPARLGYWLAGIVGTLSYHLLGKKRRALEGNLRQVLGADVGEGRLASVAKEVFRSSAKNYFDLFRVPKMSVPELEKFVKVEGWEHVYNALAAGKGLIMFTGHIGNLELLGQVVVSRNLRATVPVEHVKPERLFRLVVEARAARGLHMVALDQGALKAIYKALKANEIVGIGSDRAVQGTGLSTEFFGKVTTMPDATAVLALRTGAVVLPVQSVRQRDNSYIATVHPPMEMLVTGDIREDVKVNTERMIRVLEDQIRANPEQWVVFDPVWDHGTDITVRSGERVSSTAG